MPTFKAPQYTKSINPKTGAQEATYVFNIETDMDESLSFIAENEADISLKSLQKCVLDNLNWWNTFVKQFLDSSSKYFSKPYTVEAINKITKHTLDGSKVNIFPVNIVLVPKNIKIAGGVFTVNWTYEIGTMIDIPDFVEDSTNTNELPPVSKNKVIDGIQELNLDDLPVGDESTDEALDLDSPAKFYDKQRVKEARLKAKLALYKAQRQMAMYYDKYGSDISDSESESEYDSSDEGNSEDEEVQL